MIPLLATDTDVEAAAVSKNKRHAPPASPNVLSNARVSNKTVRLQLHVVCRKRGSAQHPLSAAASDSAHLRASESFNPSGLVMMPCC